jgi:integrase
MLDVNSPALGAPPLQLPANVGRLPRELSSQEVRSLWDAGSAEARLVIAGLFGGLSIEELAALRYEDIDLDADRIRTTESSNRSLILREPLRCLLRERASMRSSGSLVTDANDTPLSTADFEGLIACAACDGGLAYAAEVNSGVLRHTYLAYLVRQGARLADIGNLVSGIAPGAVREYSHLSPPGPGLPLEKIDAVFPTLHPQGA